MTQSLVRSVWLSFAAATLLGCSHGKCPSNATERDGVCVKNTSHAITGDGGSGDGGGLDGALVDVDATQGPAHALADAAADADGGGLHHGGTHASDGHEGGGDGALDAGAHEPAADGGNDASAARDGGDATPDAGSVPPPDASTELDAAEPDSCMLAACDPLATCTVKDHAALCTCPLGYAGDGKTCTRDYCVTLDGAPACGPHATCTPAAAPDISCACATDYGDCVLGEAQPGCETHLTSSHDNCGACGHVCAARAACSAGVCEQAAARLVAGNETSCALLTASSSDPAGHALTCWGRNTVDGLDYRVLGDPAFEDLYDANPHAVPDLRVRELAVGTAHACAIRGADDAVVCWGDNARAQLGQATSSVSAGSRAVKYLPGVTKVAVGGAHTCAVVGGVVKCWGDNQYHQLGAGTTAAKTPTPVVVAGLPTNIIDVRAAALTSCALTQDQHVWCWPVDSEGHAAAITVDKRGTQLSDALELQMGGGDTDSQFNFFACARRASKALLCWGYHYSYVVPGMDAYVTPFTTTTISALPAAITQIAVGAAHLCVLGDGGHVYCMGAKAARGALGLPVPSTPYSVPTLVPGIDDAIELVAGGWHTCIRRASGQVQCWGRNEMGELGDGSTLLSYMPVNVSGLP